MQKKNLLIILVIIIAFFGLFIGLDNKSEKEKSPQKETTYLSEIDKQVNLKNFENEDVKLNDFKGSPLLINSWAIWCPFCVEELKDFAEAKDQLNGDLKIIAINRAESKQETEEFISNLGVKNDLTFLLDPNDSFYQAIGGFSMPETVFVNKEGKMIFHKRGPMDLIEIKEEASKRFEDISLDSN